MEIFLIHNHFKIVQILFTSAQILIAVILSILFIYPDPFPPSYFNFSSSDDQEEVFPDTISSGLSRAYFSYSSKLMNKGYSSQLEFSSFWSLDPGHRPEEAVAEFKKNLENYKKKYKNWEKTPWLFLNLMKSTLFSMSAAVILVVFLTFSSLTEPLFLNFIVNSVQKENPIWIPLILASISSFLSTCWFGASTRGDFYGQRGYIAVKSILLNTVYSKVLKLAPEARLRYSQGEVINVLTTDSERVRFFWFTLLDYFYSFFMILCTFLGLFYIIGHNVFYGFAVILFFLPINSVLVRLTAVFERRQMKYKDQRLKLMSDILSGIRVLKLYAWEESMRKRVDDLRKKEVSELKKAYISNAIFSGALAMCPLLSIVSAFAGYVLIDGHPLTPQVAFISLMLFNELRFAVYSMPTLIHQAIKVTVSLKRIEKFLLEEEIEDQVSTFLPNEEGVIFSLKNSVFSWMKDPEAVSSGKIGPLEVDIRSGELVGVVGRVGSGKSSFLKSLCGEMYFCSGDYFKKEDLKIAYVPQESWIQNLTLKENILFDKNLDEGFYKEVLERCALNPDLKVLPSGDMTEIGEKGLNLSGGQKARVSLARAVYQDLDVYILDDTLSAVDSHVGSHIFEKVISNQGILGGKTRIFALNSIGYLSKCDRIIVMKDCKILDIGTFSELSSKNSIFTDLVQELKLKEEQHQEESKKTKLSISLEEPLEVPSEEHPEEVQTENSKLIEVEAMSREKVSFKMYVDYARAFGLVFVAGYFGLMFFVRTALESSAQIFMSRWSTEAQNLTINEFQNPYSMPNYSIPNYTILKNPAVDENIHDFLDYNDFGNRTTDKTKNVHNLLIYSALGISSCFVLMLANSIVGFGAFKASRKLHDSFLISLLKSPIEFFDKTPMGRILNRLSKDIDVVDEVLPRTLSNVLTSMSNVMFYLVSSIFVMPYLTVITIPFIFGIFFTVRYFTKTTVQIRRLTSQSWSAVASHLQDSYIGSDSIRIFRKQEKFKKDMMKNGEKNIKVHMGEIVANRWISQKMDMLAELVTDGFTFLGIYLGSIGVVNAGVLALVISTGSMLRGVLGRIARLTRNVEIDIVSVERIQEYIDNEKEAEWRNPDFILPKDWPTKGEIEFKDLSFRYRKSTPLVLDNFSIKFESGKKIGIVGRTGAGKTSLTLALFRIVEPDSGTIFIDDIDYRKIGLHDLRNSITIIPQDPVLFCGTLRANLDPFDEFEDAELLDVLQKSHLSNFFEQSPSKLDYEISEGGSNLSVGQRQLVCLARAILRQGTKMLVLDEATASVDFETDQLIQKSIREEFQHCTILTIAHRLNTILDYDKVLVLDAGEVKEYDSPQKLLEDKKSLFYGFAREAKIV